MKRIKIEEANGLKSIGEGKGHAMIDRTRLPALCIQAQRPVAIEITDDGKPDDGKPDDGKPPYRVPSMKEIAAIPPNGFKVASTFSGCGGSSLGYRMAGFKVIWANEFIPAAQDSYRANMAEGTILDCRDIRTIQPEEILEQARIIKGELDILDGSPPCAAFSTAGKRDAGWGKVKKYSDTTQRVDDLFFEFVRILRGLAPKTFIAENVSGLVNGTAKGYFLEILSEFKASGYRVKCKVLDAQWLGVPQMRQRTIFVGVRDDIDLDPVHPLPLPYRYSVRDALPEILRVDINKDFDRQVANMDSSASPYMTVGASPSSGNGRAGKIETKTEKRKFTIAELKRICAFPDDFILTGTYAQQWERLGRSVPPVMMRAIAGAIRDGVLAHAPR